MMPEEFEEGTVKEVEMHDGSLVVLKKLERDYDPTNKWNALQILEDAQQNNWLITGLIYVKEDEPALYELYNLPEISLEPTNRKRTTTQARHT